MAATKKKTVPQKSGSAADFRKADIDSTVAYNKLLPKQERTPSYSSGTTTTGSLGGYSMNDIKQLFGRYGGGGGAGMTAKDRAEIALERRKLNMQNRQFNRELASKESEFGRELAFKQGQFDTEKQRYIDELTRRQGGMGDYIAAIQGQIDAGPTNTALYDTLSKLAAGAQTNITSSYDALDAALKNIVNPFAGYQAQAVSSPTAGLEQFLSSQGVGTDDLTRFAQLQQAQSQQQAQAVNNLMAQLGGVFTGGQQSRQAEAAMGRTADTNALAMNQLLAQAQLGQQGQSQMDELRRLLLQAQMQKAAL